MKLPSPLKYVRFHSPVPNHENSEPVYEFRLTGTTEKYKVEGMTLTKDGLEFTSHGDTNFVPLANIIYARFLDNIKYVRST